VLESACFDPGLIHSASADLGVASESSRRFERGVDVTAVGWAGRLAAGLMVEHASASASPGSTDVWPVKPQPRRIRCRYGRGRDLLGMRISDGEMADIFVRLGMNVDEKDAGGCTVTAPAFRPDIEVEADLFEEVARVHGLGEVASAPPRSALVPESDDVEERAVAECRKTVMALGFSEIVNYSFVSAALLDLFGKGNAGGRLVLPNPVSSDYAVMRDSLVPQMVETMGRNAAHQVPDVLFFEMGRVFGVSDGASIEEGRLCMGLSGKAGRVEGSIRTPATAEEVFLRIKGAAEALGAALKTGRFSFRSEDREWTEPGWCVMVELAGAPVGVIGLVKSALRREWRFAEPVGICEMSIAPLIANCFSSPVLSDIPAYPSISRDVAMIVDDSVTHEQVVSAIRAAGPPELTEVLLFDTFRSESMGPGKRSLAYTLEYRSGVRTLTDEEANAFHDKVKEALRSGLKAEIRES